jgi:proteasome lid subunit RPN8/RPN11
VIILSPGEISACIDAAEIAFPREASGILLARAEGGHQKLSVVITPNDRNTFHSFVVAAAEFNAVRSRMETADVRICGVFHSHIFGAARASQRDREAEKAAGDLWLIYSLRTGDLKLFEWDGAEFTRTRFRMGRGSRGTPA